MSGPDEIEGSNPEEPPAKDPEPEAPEPEAPKPPASEVNDTFERVRPYLSLVDFAAVPRTKAGWAIRCAVVALTFLLFERRVVTATARLRLATPPAPITTEVAGDVQFDIPETTRHRIFDDLAVAELAERARAIQANTWNGHVWSREDDRGHYERVAARAAAARYRVTLTQVYLVLDEGLREHWLAPNGQPLPPTTPALNMRKNSW